MLLNRLNIISYADGTLLIVSLSKDPSTARANFHRCMMNVTDWMKDNSLKLKTEVLIFGNTSPWNEEWWPAELSPPLQITPATSASSWTVSSP